MKKFKLIFILYTIIILFATLYCKPNIQDFISFITATIASVAFSYFMILVVKLLEFTGGAKFFMRISSGIVAYFPYLVCFQFFILLLISIVMLFTTKVFENIAYVLPFITSIHAANISRRILTDNYEEKQN